MSPEDLTLVANLLQETMTNAGIMDDYDELLVDIFEGEDGVQSAVTYHNSVLTGVEFINTYSRCHVEVTYFENTFQEVSSDF